MPTNSDFLFVDADALEAFGIQLRAIGDRVAVPHIPTTPVMPGSPISASALAAQTAVAAE
ncbi:hypothetical protein FOS14_15600 [Skermania sp. ID1734]|uniref:hypothetical protein n=1 Tax=Skermania sp. ID1734 TaxID=2597516 RepID=UPI00117C2F9A|nr:hypothetical protein [Skermania sp. ID1734]TSD96498.1 hypothetical protein FOS14_15600 [Skermania sp. ID1734]